MISWNSPNYTFLRETKSAWDRGVLRIWTNYIKETDASTTWLNKTLSCIENKPTSFLTVRSIEISAHWNALFLQFCEPRASLVLFFSYSFLGPKKKGKQRRTIASPLNEILDRAPRHSNIRVNGANPQLIRSFNIEASDFSAVLLRHQRKKKASHEKAGWGTAVIRLPLRDHVSTRSCR